MRWMSLAILSLMLSPVSLAQGADPLCVLDPAQMPESWRPAAGAQKGLNPAPWSKSEARDAEYAIKVGLDEMIRYFKQNPSVVQNLWDDSIEALIQVTHSSANKPEIDRKARDAARKNLTALLAPYVDRDPEWAICDEFDHLLPLAIFAHRLYSSKDTLTNVATKRTNAAYRACGSLDAAMEIDAQRILASKEARAADLEDLFDLYVWALWFIEAELYPDIKLPIEARKFGPAVWKFFATYRLGGAREFAEGASDEKFIRIANLAIRIAHIPTGTHRFPLYVKDKPDLYRFFRENFYPVRQLDRPDLVGSFVVALRQYGCTAENDVQVRDGSRYLLKVFHDSNGRWMNYRGKGERNADLADDELIYYPWKGVLGLRVRQPEEPKPGTYGGIVRRWLPPRPQRN